MAESHPNKEQDVGKPPIMVTVDNYRIGHLITEEGDSFNLHNLLGDTSRLGGDAFSRLYFRTESGNIYQLDRHGRLVDGKLSQEQKYLQATQLDKKSFEKTKLTVGEYFVYGAGDTPGITDRIAEIVPTNDRLYRPD